MNQKPALTRLFLLGFVYLLVSNLHSQSLEIKGNVLDKNTGTPIAQVTLLSGDVSTQTDSNGNYQLLIENPTSNPYIQVFHPEFQSQQLPIDQTKATQTIDVQLEASTHLLDQVVVVGNNYKQTKSTTGNNIVVIDRQSLESSASNRLSDDLRGISGGLVMQNSGNPGGGFSVRLRGPGTILGNSEPLYIIDGVIVNNDSPELLDLGGYSQNRLIDIQPEDIERVEVIKGASASAIYGSRASNGVVQIFTKSGGISKPIFRFSSSLIHNSLRKKIPINEVPLQWVNPSDNSTTETIPANRYDFQDEFFTNAWGTENYLSVRGGSKDTKYFVSGGFLENGGIIKNTSFQRYSARINVTQKLSDKLELSLYSNYVVSKSQDKPNGGMEEGYGAITGFIFSDNANSPYPDDRGIYPPTSDLLPRPNPLEVVNRYDFSQQTNRFIGGASLDYELSEKLTLTFQSGIDQYNQDGEAFIPQENTSSFNLGYSNRASTDVLQTNNDLNLRHFGELGNFNFMTVAGFGTQFNRTTNFGLEVRDLDPFIEITESGIITDRIDQRLEWGLMGGFLQETIGWKEKLYLTLGLRSDASTVFATDQKWQWYPKANIAWVLSRESFWQDRLGGIVDLFKIRAAYGEAGNLTAIAPFSQNAKYVTEQINDQTGLVTSSQLGNNSVAPERQKELEVGVDIALFDNRVGIELSWYRQTIEDLLITYVLAPSEGFTSSIGNIGRMVNRGFEIQTNFSIIRSKDWDWDVGITYSKNQNEVFDIPGGRLTLSPSFATSYAINGQPLGVFYRQYYARTANGSIALSNEGLPFIARDEDGNALQKVIGNPNPDWFGALTSEIRYRKFSFRMFLDAVQGFDVFNWNRRLMNNQLFGGGPNVGRELAGELPKGYGSAESGVFEAFVEDGSFVKVREIGLAYLIDQPINRIRSLKIELTARNVFSFDKYQAWDPELNTPGQNNGVRGFDFAEVPIPRTFLTKLTITF